LIVNVCTFSVKRKKEREKVLANEAEIFLPYNYLIMC
jgi:hypothetical protein